MFGLGPPEILLIGVVALLVFGPKRLPELAKGLGKGIRDFKKALEDKSHEEERDKNLPPAHTSAPLNAVSREKSLSSEEKQPS
jgi:TatA/E family protein of Tat protein translocase